MNILLLLNEQQVMPHLFYSLGSLQNIPGLLRRFSQCRLSKLIAHTLSDCKSYACSISGLCTVEPLQKEQADSTNSGASTCSKLCTSHQYSGKVCPSTKAASCQCPSSWHCRAKPGSHRDALGTVRTRPYRGTKRV